MSTNRAAFTCSGEARPRSRKMSATTSSAESKCWTNRAKGFRQTIESLLRESKILDDGLGWVRPPFSLVVREKVLESARVANGFAN